MKRFERRRLERLRRAALVIGLSFAAGALADSALSWRLARHSAGGEAVLASAASAVERAADAANTPAHDPAAPRAVQRPRGDEQPAPVSTTGTVVNEAVVDVLRDRDLELPVQGVDRDDLVDTFADGRGTRKHEAIDIMAPRSTQVRAVEDGHIQKLFTSKAGGLSIYQFEPSGLFTYYYAHLDRYADGLHEGQPVKKGDLIGYVGSTGNASPDAPHLHFAIFRQTAERQWWTGDPINPFPVLR